MKIVFYNKEKIVNYTLYNDDFKNGVACVHTNRNFIGIEIDENYFNIAKERIEKSQIAN